MTKTALVALVIIFSRGIEVKDNPGTAVLSDIAEIGHPFFSSRQSLSKEQFDLNENRLHLPEDLLRFKYPLSLEKGKRTSLIEIYYIAY